MALSTGIDIACGDENRRGGVKTLWITERDNVTDFTAGTDHDYTAVTLTSTAVKFYKFEFEAFTGDFNYEGSAENGSKVLAISGDFQIPKQEKVKGATIQELFNTCKVVAIYEDYNNKFFTVGYDEVLEETAALSVVVSSATGKALQDGNAYTIAFSGQSAELAREFTGDTTDSAKFEQ